MRVSGEQPTDVSVNPGAVAFGTVAQGAKASQAVKVKYTGRTRDWKITEVVPAHGPFDVKVTETSRGGPLRGGAEYHGGRDAEGERPARPARRADHAEDERPGEPADARRR